MSSIKNPLFLSTQENTFQTLLDVTVEIIKQNDQQDSLKIISNLHDLTTAQPKFVAAFIEKILFIITEVIHSDQLSEAIRISCANYLVTLGQTNTQALKNSSYFAQQTLVILFRVLIANVEEENFDEMENFEENNVSNQSIYSAIVIALSSMAHFMKGKFLFQQFVPLCRESLNSDQWKAQHVGLLLIGILSEDAKKNFMDDFDKIMGLILPFLKSSHPKVVYSCLTSISLLCEEFSPQI